MNSCGCFLKKTINADAASQQKGIGYLAGSMPAGQKWAKSHFLRMFIISDTYLEYAVTGRKDISNELNHNKIKKDDSLDRTTTQQTFTYSKVNNRNTRKRYGSSKFTKKTSDRRQ